jgi:hypothetical protein
MQFLTQRVRKWVFHSRKNALTPGFSSKSGEILHTDRVPQPAGGYYFCFLNFEIPRPGGPFKGKKWPKMAIFFHSKEKIGDIFFSGSKFKKQK